MHNPQKTLGSRTNNRHASSESLGDLLKVARAFDPGTPAEPMTAYRLPQFRFSNKDVPDDKLHIDLFSFSKAKTRRVHIPKSLTNKICSENNPHFGKLAWQTGMCLSQLRIT